MLEISHQINLPLQFKYLSNQMVCFDVLPSTNNWLKKFNCKFNKNFNVFTKKQIAGRGRLEREWIDRGENLAFSIFLQKTPIQSQFIPIITGLAIYKTLSLYIQDDLSIKWPNDILVKDKKICGILCETTSNQHNQGVIIGIGVNLKTALTDYEKDLQSKITSLKENTSMDFSVHEICTNIMIHIDVLLQQFILDQEKLIYHWNDLCNSINKNIQFEYNNAKEQGVILGIDFNGHLLIKLEKDESIIKLISGEVEFLSKEN